MNKTALSLASLLAVASAPAFADNYYGALRLQNAEHTLANAKLTSPRVDDRISSPDRDYDLNGSIALGYAYSNGWRIEGEYTAHKKSHFDSYWSPFDANVNRMKVESQRVMLNGFKHLDVGNDVSVYAMAGVGMAKVSANGYQSNPGRQFDKNTQNNFAYAVGVGADYKLTDKVTLGTGYRYVNMGKIETGHNSFANRINARDEQLKGKLSEQSVFFEARVAL